MNQNILHSAPLALSSAVAAFLALALSGCQQPPSSTSTPPTDPRLEALFLTTEPTAPSSVLAARKTASPGDTITVAGRIAGAMEPFSKDLATLTLADDTLRTCDQDPDDQCETPWDACCVEPKTLAALRISVQVNDEDGRPLPHTLKGVHGLIELDPVVITGTVAEGSTAENLILHATGIYRKKS